MLSFETNKVKKNCLIYSLSFFIGVYCSCYVMSIHYISLPIDHWCSPPFDFSVEHWSPKDWKRYVIPYWDQIPDSFKSWTKPNTQSKCLQFTIIRNMTNSTINFEIKYSVDYVIPCQFGWYFSNHELSIISQLELVCKESWILTMFPIIFSIGFLLSLIILKFERYMHIMYITITAMLATSLCICIVHDLKVFITLRFLSSFCFGANFLLSILLITKLNVRPNYDKMLLSGIVGWLLPKGSIPSILWLLKSWKIVHILMSFSVVPVILLGVVLFKSKLNESLIKNIKYMEETDENDDEYDVKPKSKLIISAKCHFAVVLMSSLIYFYEECLLYKKMEIFNKTTYNSFIIASMLQFFVVSIIFIAKRKCSIFSALLVSLIITCICNAWLSYKGLFGDDFKDYIKDTFDIINKIGVSGAFYANLIIVIVDIEDKTLINLGLLIVITASYGISPFISELEFVSQSLPNHCFTIALLIVIVWFVIELVRRKSIGRTIRNEQIIYLKSDSIEDQCVINES